MIHALRRVFLHDFRKRVQETPACRLFELFVGRLLELTVDRKNVAGIDNAELGSTHDAASGFVIVLEVDVLQVLAHGFGHQEVVLQRSDSTVDQIGQFKPAGMLAFDDGGPAESEI